MKIEENQENLENLLLRITELEKALQASEDKFKSLYQSHLMMLIIDYKNGKIIDANPSACQFYGYALGEIKQKTIFELNHLTKEEVIKQMQLAVTETRSHFDFTHILANGELRHVEVHSGPIQINGQELLYSIIQDNTEKLLITKTLEESEKYHRSLMELAPCGIIVYCDYQIVFANPAAAKMLGAKKPENLEGLNFLDLIDKEYQELAIRRIKKVIINRKSTPIIQYEFKGFNKNQIQVEAASTFFEYSGKPAVQTVFWDITERKKEIERAARIQKQRLTTGFPLPQKAKLEVLYKPASFISGDLFHFYCLNDQVVIGLLADIMGKGISAALSNSAIKVLFYEIAGREKDPLKILGALNKEIPEFIGEEYVAACCFAFDFGERNCHIASAGINRFSVRMNGRYFPEEILHGSFLGMFRDSVFENKSYSFQKGDVFYFYTDGLDDFLEKSWVNKKFVSFQHIAQQKKFLDSVTFDNEGVSDDLTWLAIEII